MFVVGKIYFISFVYVSDVGEIVIKCPTKVPKSFWLLLAFIIDTVNE